MNIAKLYDKCINCYSHEGEFTINGNTITIFRRSSYEDFDNTDENGDPKWIEGDEAVGAFVNQEAFFGWWSQDRDDLYECMKEVLEYLLTNKDLKVTLSATISRYSDADETKVQRKLKLFDELKKVLFIENEQVKVFNVAYNTFQDTASCKIVNFNDFYALLEILTNQVENVSIHNSDPNKEALENMFKYRYDIL